MSHESADSADLIERLDPASQAWARYYAAAETDAAARAQLRERQRRAARRLTTVLVSALAVAAGLAYFFLP